MPTRVTIEERDQALAEPTLGDGEPSSVSDQNQASIWTPDTTLTNGIVHLLEDALKSGHSRIATVARKEGKPTWRDLISALRIDHTSFTQWSKGREDRADRITSLLEGLFLGREYIDLGRERQDDLDDRKFSKDILKYWAESDAEALESVCVLLTGHRAKIDKLMAVAIGAKHAQRRLMLLSAAAAKKQEGGSPDFVVDPTPETLPPALRLPQGRQIAYREATVATLRTLFTDHGKDGVLVTLVGEPLAGKSAVFQKLAQELTTPQAGQRPSLAMLHVALGRASRPLRALYLAVRGSDGLGRSGIQQVGAEDDGEDESRTTETEFLGTHIPHRIGARSLIAFVEDFAELAGMEAECRELAEIFKLGPFRRGFTILESAGETAPAPTLKKVSLRLPNISVEQAVDFLSREYQLGACAKEAVDHLGSNLLHPGILYTGAFGFQPSVVTASREAVTAEDLALAIMETVTNIAETVVTRLSANECEPRAAMQSLMAMSVFGAAPINQTHLDKAKLAPIPRKRLVTLGWLDASQGESLAGFGLDALRAAAKVTLAEGSASREGSEELRAAIQRLAADLFHERDGRMSAILEETVAWLGRHAPREAELQLRLKALLAQESFSDPVSPFVEDGDRTLASELFRRGEEQRDLDFAVGSLAEYAREASSGKRRPGDQVRIDFLNSLDSVSGLLRTSPELSSRQLFALDGAIYVGSHQLHLYEKALEVRKAIAPVLAGREDTVLKERNRPWISAWLSFLINMADLSLSLGDHEAALTSSENARKIVEDAVWFSDDSWKEWLLARLSLLRARLASDMSTQKAELVEATEHAGLCVAYAPDEPRCVTFYLRTVRRLVDAEGDEGARRQHVDDAKQHLEMILGPSDGWDVSTGARFAALMRQEARRAWDKKYREIRGREALALLQTASGGEQEIDSNPQALLGQARLQAFLGEADAALVSCDKALKIAPSPAAWHLKLRLLDSTGAQQEWSDDPDLSELHRSSLMPQLKQALDEFRRWSSADSEGNPSYGKVMLWTIQREWQSQGSLERHVATALRRQGIDYAGLRKAEKLNRLRAEYEKRNRQLESINKKFFSSNSSNELIRAEFENAAQFTRSESVLTGDDPKIAVPLRVIERGLERFPGSHILRFWRAEYLRYIWDVDPAIEDFRELRATATNGELRRQASINLARCLHTAMVHREDASEEQHISWAKEATDLVEQLSGDFWEAEEIAILRDHIALESGRQVDWSSLENMYKKIVGAIGGFPSTLIQNYDEIFSNTIGAPTNIAEALQRNFASPECLGLAGLLYLRRAEKKFGNRQQEDFACAVAFVRAQALMERSWSSQEYPVTSFRIGRAILSAAKNFANLNPIQGLDTEGKANQLALAETKFNSAASRSAGKFRLMAQYCQGEAARLATALR